MRTLHPLHALVLVAALLPAGASAEQLTSEPGAQPSDTWFVDGPRRVEVERLGPAALDPRGRSLAPIRLRYSKGREVSAFVDRTAVVELAPGAEASLAARGVRVVRPLMPSIGLWLVEDQSGGDGLDAAIRLRDDGARAAGIRQAIPNLYLHTKAKGEPYTPDDPRFSGQWYFENLGMKAAWGLSQGDPAVTIVVVDSGCDLTHPDLVAKMDPGLDVVDDDDDPTYDNSASGSAHGTSCAGLVAASTDNGEGMAGACPACRIRCVRMLSDAPVPISADVDAFQFALDVDAEVVSNSWGFKEALPVPKPLEDAINNVFDHGRGGKGAMVVFAAGNDGRLLGDDELEGVRGVLCVGAINNFDDQTSFTNYGPSVDLVAPTGTLTTDIQGSGGDDPGNYTSLFGGTSSSCPVVAGIAGLLVSAAPERTSQELYDVLIATTRKAPYALPDENGHDDVFGYGIVDPVPALEEVLGFEQPTGSGGGGGSEETGDGGGCDCSTPGGASDPRSGLPRLPGALAAGLYAAALGLVRWRRRRG